MFPPVLLALAVILLAPWSADEAPLEPVPDVRLPVALAAEAVRVPEPDGFNAAAASARVVEGVAERLRARGVSVAPDRQGSFLLAPSPTAAKAAARPVTLSVGFNSGANRRASGTETRFGAGDDASWRLAALVQRNLVGGLRDVLAYDSYDRGVVEQRDASSPSGSPPESQATDPWVATYPLFATNPRERDLLEWPETLDLISAALAHAIYGYLDPSESTPPRDNWWGWRRSDPWQPVSPILVSKASGATRVALTFDGGASSAPTPPILKALKEAGVRATMFMTADYVEKNPDLVIQMARDGHEFGNHSSTHPDMTKLSPQAIVSQLDRLESAVQALTGRSTRPWFRPPFGAQDERLRRVVAEQGYYTILWTADSADWREDVSAANVQRRLLTYATPGAIIVQHLGSPQSAQVLAEVLKSLKERGLQFGTLSEVLGPLD